jgi:hypothetical protein
MRPEERVSRDVDGWMDGCVGGWVGGEVGCGACGWNNSRMKVCLGRERISGGGDGRGCGWQVYINDTSSLPGQACERDRQPNSQAAVAATGKKEQVISQLTLRAGQIRQM